MLKGFRDFHVQMSSRSMYCIHELVVKTRQVSSVAQLVRALHRNRRAAGLIPARGPIYIYIVVFFAAAPGLVYKRIKFTLEIFIYKNPSTFSIE